MAVQKIISIPNKLLYQPSEPVTKFDRELRDLVRDMFDSMYYANGVGLAAVQISVLKRVLVLDLEEQGFIKRVFINPRLLEQSDEMQGGEEGCLSVPGISVPLKRPRWAKIAYQDITGAERTAEGEMLLARAMLHEMDHLDGKVFVDLLEPNVKLAIQGDLELIEHGKRPRTQKIPAYRQKVS